MKLARMMTWYNLLGIGDHLPEIELSPVTKLALSIILGAVVGAVIAVGFSLNPIVIGSCAAAGAISALVLHYFPLKFDYVPMKTEW